MSVTLEMGVPDGWVRAGPPVPEGQYASFSSHELDGRHVYLFGFLRGQPGIWRSERRVRMPFLHVLRLEFVADLARGPHEMDVQRPTGRRRVRISLQR